MLYSMTDIKTKLEKSLKCYEEELKVLKVVDFKKNKDGSYSKKMILNLPSYLTEFKQDMSNNYKYAVLIKVGNWNYIYFNDVNEFRKVVDENIKTINDNINRKKVLLEKLPSVYEKVKEMYQDIENYIVSEGFHSKYSFGL